MDLAGVDGLAEPGVQPLDVGLAKAALGLAQL